MAKDGGFYGCVEDYVKERGGNRPIKKVGGLLLCVVRICFCWLCRQCVAPVGDVICLCSMR